MVVRSRRELFHMQRELLRERTRCRALEEQLENPMNVHRWRKLEVCVCMCLWWPLKGNFGRQFSYRYLIFPKAFDHKLTAFLCTWMVPKLS